MKKVNLMYLLVIPFSIYLILNTSIVHAATPPNDIYQIQIEDIDTAPQRVNTQKNVNNELKKVSNPLSLSVSDTLVDFGLLQSGNPAKRTTMISVEAGSMGYQVLSFEDHPLQSEAGTLADTTCDNGSCSETLDSAWDNELTFGFGFTTGYNYKQFADLSKHEQPQTVMANEAKTAQVVFKANVSASQKPASLSNIITFVAVPNF